MNNPIKQMQYNSCKIAKRKLEAVHRELDHIVHLLPSGDSRNAVCDMNIAMFQLLDIITKEIEERQNATDPDDILKG